jgi:mannitol/fructose-specific phosphotransferase system IIA component (Ntr-type)
MKLSELVGADDVVLGVRARDVAGVAAEILRRALPHHGFSAETTERLIAGVIAREREMPTTCGASAIPHARDSAVTSFVVAIGTNGEGLIEGQHEPRVIIAFLSPASKTAEHLELLRTLSGLAHDTKAMNAIAEAVTAADVVALLNR